MTTSNQACRVLRRAALSAAMLLIAASGAFADPPGYLFKDIEPDASAAVSAAPHHARRANAQNSLSPAQAGEVCAALGLDSADPYGRCSTNLQKLVGQSERAQDHSK